MFPEEISIFTFSKNTEDNVGVLRYFSFDLLRKLTVITGERERQTDRDISVNKQRKTIQKQKLNHQVNSIVENIKYTGCSNTCCHLISSEYYWMISNKQEQRVLNMIIIIKRKKD